MQKTDPRYAAYAAIWKKHLRPAMGCTEPIAIAYAAAVARRALGDRKSTRLNSSHAT